MYDKDFANEPEVTTYGIVAKKDYWDGKKKYTVLREERIANRKIIACGIYENEILTGELRFYFKDGKKYYSKKVIY